jgi:signal transduction histidine kinase
MKLRQGSWIAYVGLLAAAFAVAMLASWTFGEQVDRSAYDWMFRRYQPEPWKTQSVILAIDEATLRQYGEMGNIRTPLAEALHRVALGKPSAVAVDVILASARDPKADETLAAALRATPNLVLATELTGPAWEEPLEIFRKSAAAVGHVHANPDEDWVTRSISLDRRSNPHGAVIPRQHYAIALEAYRLSRGVELVETPEDILAGSAVIPAPRPRIGRQGRMLRIRYVPPSMPPIPRVSMKDLLADATQQVKFAGKVVFVGVTAQSEVRDKLATPYSQGVPMAGVEIHANVFETLNSGQFLTDARPTLVLLFCAALAAAAGLAFAYLSGWPSYLVGLLLLAAGHVAPYVFFTHGRVFSFVFPASTAWFSTVTAGAWQSLVVRRRLRRSEADRARYQQTIHFVTHEMRTPLSAIQGSSELISRYALTEEKRKQVALLINSESKRLARMIEVFLNVEKLSAGQMELKREPIDVRDLIEVCHLRASPLAERKRIEVVLKPAAEALHVTGDRELMEYACYNLLTNAIKYSPQKTVVTVSSRRDDNHIRIAVEDQGIGMDQKEVKKIFQKFYRTKRAEESGEVGTGIGLSIVQQIVEQHGGRIDVVSRPGEGSCFTLVLPAAAENSLGSAAPAAAQQR